MFPKSRETFGRTRTSPRSVRRAPVANDAQAAYLGAARQVAARFVAERWPELAAVEPVIMARLHQPPSSDLLARLGLGVDDLVLRADSGVEYTFTFARDDSPEAALCAPLVAVVTVDGQQRIVKTSASK